MQGPPEERLQSFFHLKILRTIFYLGFKQESRTESVALKKAISLR